MHQGLICEAAALSSNTTACTPKPVEGTTIEVGIPRFRNLGNLMVSWGFRGFPPQKKGSFCENYHKGRPLSNGFFGVVMVLQLFFEEICSNHVFFFMGFVQHVFDI